VFRIEPAKRRRGQKIGTAHDAVLLNVLQTGSSLTIPVCPKTLVFHMVCDEARLVPGAASYQLDNDIATDRYYSLNARRGSTRNGRTPVRI
jgi:hypothetical protein